MAANAIAQANAAAAADAPTPAVQQTFYLTLKEGPAIGDSAQPKISYHGDIREDTSSCFISFPGKYASGWEALTRQYHEDSVACIFLCNKDDGAGLNS